MNEYATNPQVRVLVVAYDIIGRRMAGPGIRSWNIACALADHADVTVTSSEDIGRAQENITTVRWRSEHHLGQLANSADVVICQGLALRHHPQLKQTDAALLIDLYDPWIFENIQLHMHLDDHARFHATMHEIDLLNELIDSGDFFFCASERQRDYWLGMLTARGRIDPATWSQDPDLRALIDVVPYGCPSDRPSSCAPTVRGHVPGIDDDSTLLLWSGGAWEWFDPILVIEALSKAYLREPSLRLYFMGLGLEGRTAAMPVVRALHTRVFDLGIDDLVAFGDWVPYDDRGGVLREADAAVLTAKRTAETRLSYRSRVVDHFWAGLPTITTPGDVLAELVADEAAGIVVPFNDVERLADAFVVIARDHERRKLMSKAALALGQGMTWNRLVGPLMAAIASHEELKRLRELRRSDAARASSHIGRRKAPDVLLHRAATELGAAPESVSGPGPSQVGGRDLLLKAKRSRLYPMLRIVRRSRLGRRVWGPLPPS